MVGSVYGSPIVSNGNVYLGAEGGGLYAMDAATGTLKWNFPNGNFRSSPVVFDGVVYLSSYANIWAVDAINGTLKWNYPATTNLEDMLSSACVVDKLGNVFVSSVSGSHN